MADLHFHSHTKSFIYSLSKKTKRASAEMAFSKSKFLTLFLLFFRLHHGFANEEVVDDLIAQSEIVGQRLPYVQDCCNYEHTGNCIWSPTCCGGGDYCNPPCVQNPSNRCCSGPGCQPSPTCPWQGPCTCVRSNDKVEGQHEAHHPSSESMPPKH